MKPTLLIMAAGMGSRYGGLKQLDPLGPKGETIMDYSVYDAIYSGFEDVIFVVRESFKKEFEEKVVSKYRDKVKVHLVTQELNDLPNGFTLNPNREKPWGTGQAVLAAKEIVKRPFAVINADDYYGRESFTVLSKYLNSLDNNSKGKYCMIGFELDKTLSESGSVSRGICKTANCYLTQVEEHTNIIKENGIIKGEGMDGVLKLLDADACTSMNMWGFTPDFMENANNLFIEFLKENINEPKKEFYVPFVVSQLINSNIATVEVLNTPDAWFGVTYKEDRERVVEKFKQMSNDGIYPTPLF